MLNKAELYYFSPTGGTRRAGEIFCEGIAKNVRTINLGSRHKEAEGQESELFVVAVPVFGGRIPVIVAEKLNQLEGKGRKAATLVIYGNRVELNNIMEERGL